MDEMIKEMTDANFRANATGRSGHRYNHPNSTMRPKDGVGSKGSDPVNDSMMSTGEFMWRTPRLMK